MKHRKYICSNCSIETNEARPVKGMVLCNPCNLVLIKTGKLPELGEPIPSTFIILPEYKEEINEELGWFECQHIIAEQNGMNGFDAILGNPSY